MLGALVRILTRLAGTIVKAARRMSGRDDIRADLVVERVLVVNTARDSKVCEFCASMEGRRIKMPLLGSRNFMFEYGNLSKEDGWGRGNLLPPFHPNCRCDVEVKEG